MRYIAFRDPKGGLRSSITQDSRFRVRLNPSQQVSFGNDHTGAPAWSAPERKHFRWCLAASAFLFVVHAIFSTGYLHPDEYFQTVEFASSKLGITATADLAWEYREQMRSWLQPALYVVVGEAAEAFGLRRPLLLLFVFRLVTGVVASQAQSSNVYSANVVGYVNQSLPPNPVGGDG